MAVSKVAVRVVLWVARWGSWGSLTVVPRERKGRLCWAVRWVDVRVGGWAVVWDVEKVVRRADRWETWGWMSAGRLDSLYQQDGMVGWVERVGVLRRWWLMGWVNRYIDSLHQWGINKMYYIKRGGSRIGSEKRVREWGSRWS